MNLRWYKRTIREQGEKIEELENVNRIDEAVAEENTALKARIAELEEKLSALESEASDKKQVQGAKPKPETKTK